MKEPPNHLSRDLEALRYLDALNAGDLEAVSALWEDASRDPELERMLAEIKAAMFQEIPGNPGSLPDRLGRRRRLWAVRVGAAGTWRPPVCWRSSPGHGPAPGTRVRNPPVRSQTEV